MRLNFSSWPLAWLITLPHPELSRPASDRIDWNRIEAARPAPPRTRALRTAIMRVSARTIYGTRTLFRAAAAPPAWCSVEYGKSRSGPAAGPLSRLRRPRLLIAGELLQAFRGGSRYGGSALPGVGVAVPSRCCAVYASPAS